jgi:4'-phosphopantetheinyl transferase
LRNDDVRVWYWRTESIDETALAVLLDLLSIDERERYDRFRFAHDRRDFAAAHALLRRALSECGDVAPAAWRFETNAHGKPALAQAHASDLTFNLSHTRGLVACVVARCTALGIDVEPVDRAATGREIAVRYFSPDEIRLLDAVPAHEYRRRFIDVWTLKEAYIKGIGLGLSHPLDTFSFLVGDDHLSFEGPPDATPRDWQFLLAQPVPGFRLALAVERPAHAPDCRITLRDVERQELRAGDTNLPGLSVRWRSAGNPRGPYNL